MKSIEELRKVLKSCTNEAGIEPNKFDTYWITADACDHLIDEIEAEIADNYMRLPLDADNVPIHVGDRLECYANGYEGAFTVFAVGDNTVIGNHDIEWIRDNPGKWFHVAPFCHHVKPRTLEDVLRDVWNEALDYAKSDMWRNPDEVFAERVDEIRELMDDDAE